MVAQLYKKAKPCVASNENSSEGPSVSTDEQVTGSLHFSVVVKFAEFKSPKMNPRMPKAGLEFNFTGCCETFSIEIARGLITL